MAAGIAAIVGALTSAGPVVQGITSLVERFVPDPAQRTAAALEIQHIVSSEKVAALQAAAEMSKGQAAIGAVEAADPSFFKSGWRPATGWACVVGMVYAVILQPGLAWLVGIFSVAIGANLPPPPAVDTTQMTGLLFGLLGLGGYRTIEKLLPTKIASP